MCIMYRYDILETLFIPRFEVPKLCNIKNDTLSYVYINT